MNTIRRKFLCGTTACLLVLGALNLVAQAPKQTVYVTEKGKKYHTYKECIALRTGTVKEIDISEVGDRILCGICAHRKQPKEKKETANILVLAR